MRQLIRSNTLSLLAAAVLEQTLVAVAALAAQFIQAQQSSYQLNIP
jgi:hypothetical protein